MSDDERQKASISNLSSELSSKVSSSRTSEKARISRVKQTIRCFGLKKNSSGRHGARVRRIKGVVAKAHPASLLEGSSSDQPLPFPNHLVDTFSSEAEFGNYSDNEIPDSEPQMEPSIDAEIVHSHTAQEEDVGATRHKPRRLRVSDSIDS